MKTLRAYIAFLLPLLMACGQAPMTPSDSVASTQGAPTVVAQCSDGIDNDGDGRTDLNDSGCASASDNNERIRGFIEILADDLRRDDIEFLLRELPKYPKYAHLAKVFDGWVEFTRSYAPSHICCPVRVSIFKGTPVHNHGVTGNSGPRGGYEGFRKLRHGEDYLPIRLQAGNVDTLFDGKFLNLFDEEEEKKEKRPLPAGWNHWNSFVVKPPYPASGHVDGMKERLFGYLWEVVKDSKKPHYNKNFFASENLNVPHNPHIPADRHLGVFSNVSFQRPPSYNEDMQDKYESLPRIGAQEENAIDLAHQQRLESMLVAMEFIHDLRAKLVELGIQDEVVVFFGSDNGFYYGEHGQEDGKHAPYEEAVHMPHYMWVPGVAGRQMNHLVSLVDFAPTVLDFFHLSYSHMDGRSWRPLLMATPATPAQWGRRAVAWEGIPWFQGIRYSNDDASVDFILIEWNTGFRELYNMNKDPFQTENILYWAGMPISAQSTTVQSAGLNVLPAEYGEMETLLRQLTTCGRDPENSGPCK